jgi:hypothetical protein
MRPSGKLKRFMSNADYQVANEQTRIPRNFKDLGTFGTLVWSSAFRRFSHFVSRRVNARLQTLRKGLQIRRCFRST